MKSCTLHTSDLAIGFRNTRKRFTTLHTGINLQLFSGEITCLIGQNGAGKSTLLKTFSGFLPPVKGSVFIHDEDLLSYSSARLARNVSVVLTEKIDLGSFSVFSMVALGRSPYTGFLGKISANDAQIINQAIEDAGIQHLRNRNFNELSDGEKQKVMIAKSMAQQTSLILLDEPTAFLDFTGKAETMLLLRDAAWNQRKTILLSTHDLNLALSFADRIWLMANNKPICTGTPEDLILQGFFADFFDKENTWFDTSTGTFIFESPKKGEVTVEGEGKTCEWLKKALKRKGYSVVNQNVNRTENKKIRILESEKVFFSMEIYGKKMMANSIENVLEILEEATTNNM